MKFNENAMREMFDEVKRNVMPDVRREIDAADAAFRATHTGFPEHVVLADAANALPLDLPPDVLADYAHAVAHGEPFEFVLT